MQDRETKTFFGGTARSQDATLGGLAGAAPIEHTGTRTAFLRRVYGWMFAGILATCFGGAIAVKSGMAESMLSWGWFPRIVLLLTWVFLPAAVMKVRQTPTWNVVAFAGYAAFTGFVLSTIIYLAIFLAERNGSHGGTYLLSAGGLTLAAFGALSAYAWFSKRDFSFLRGMLVVGSVVLLGAVLISFFVASSALFVAISAFGVLLMSGFVLYDTQKVLRTVPDGEHVAGAMTLFLDFVMLFIYVLNLVLAIAGGGRRN